MRMKCARSTVGVSKPSIFTSDRLGSRDNNEVPMRCTRANRASADSQDGSLYFPVFFLPHNLALGVLS